MNLEELRLSRAKWMTWKNIAPLRKALESLDGGEYKIELGDTVKISGDIDESKVFNVAKKMMPWRKGPFAIGDIFIDTEWKSNIKYNLLRPHFNLKDKRVADIGCNNGYYLFRMQEDAPKSLVGFDPSPLYKTQFDFINHFAKTDMRFELLGVEHFEYYEHRFDVAFCLGVIYHRSDPVGMLKSIRKGLNSDGVLILDTFMIDEDADIALTPKDRYAKIPNIYFVPTIRALTNWCERAGFINVEVIAITVTTENEQRKTDWIMGESLGSFLDPEDSTKTVEGYDAPKRLYMKAHKK